MWCTRQGKRDLVLQGPRRRTMCLGDSVRQAYEDFIHKNEDFTCAASIH